MLHYVKILYTNAGLSQVSGCDGMFFVFFSLNNFYVSSFYSPGLVYFFRRIEPDPFPRRFPIGRWKSLSSSYPPVVPQQEPTSITLSAVPETMMIPYAIFSNKYLPRTQRLGEIAGASGGGPLSISLCARRTVKQRNEKSRVSRLDNVQWKTFMTT